jgi:hypothetical protein
MMAKGERYKQPAALSGVNRTWQGEPNSVAIDPERTWPIGSSRHRTGVVTSTFFQVWSGLNDVMRSAILAVRSPKSFWKTVPA